MRNPEFVTPLINAIARNDQAEAQKIIEAYIKDKKGNYSEFKSFMINSIGQTLNSYAYYKQNPASDENCCSEINSTCGYITCCLSATCLCQSGSIIGAIFCGLTSSHFFKLATEERKEQANHNMQAKRYTLQSSADTLFQICDDYCQKFPLKSQQISSPISPSTPSI